MTPPRGRLREHVAEEIRVLLARKRISAAELARRTGIKQSTMSRRMTGETAFDMDDIEAIAAALDVTVQDLMPAPQAARGGGGPQATAHYFQLSERTSDHVSRPPSRPRDARPNSQVAAAGPGRSAYLPRGGRKKRDR